MRIPNEFYEQFTAFILAFILQFVKILVDNSSKMFIFV